MAVKLQFRRDTAANWETNNPILSEGELGLDTTNQRFKIGDGVNTWDNLEFAQYTNKAETFTATTTLAGSDGGSSDWTQESGGDWDTMWTVTKTVSGILATDKPLIDIDLSSATVSTYKDLQDDFGLIFRVEVTAIDTIKFYASEELAKNLAIQIKVVR